MKPNLLAALLLCAALILSACGAAPSNSPGNSKGPGVTEPSDAVTDDAATDESEPDAITDTEPDASDEINGDAGASDESDWDSFWEDEPFPDAFALEKAGGLHFALPGTWHSDVGSDILTIYENGGFELTDADSYYEGYLLYADEDGGPWQSGPRYMMYLENNEPLPNACLTWDDAKPGKLVYVSGGGAELFSRGDCAYDADGIAVRVRWADENVLSAYPAYDEYAAHTGAYETDILFVTERTLPNFKVLSIIMEDASDDGTTVFSVAELYEENPLTAEQPLLVRTSFPGDIPTNGISYTDGNGETRYFSVSESGFDGSLIMSEFQRSEKP